MESIHQKPFRRQPRRVWDAMPQRSSHRWYAVNARLPATISVIAKPTASMTWCLCWRSAAGVFTVITIFLLCNRWPCLSLLCPQSALYWNIYYCIWRGDMNIAGSHRLMGSSAFAAAAGNCMPKAATYNSLFFAGAIRLSSTKRFPAFARSIAYGYRARTEVPIGVARSIYNPAGENALLSCKNA